MERDRGLAEPAEDGRGPPVIRRRGIAALIAALLLSGCALTGGKKSAVPQPPAKAKSPAASDSTRAPAKTGATTDTAARAKAAADTASGKKPLSAATQLLLRACDNYLSVNPESPKAAEVLDIEASVYYNNRHFEECRGIYQAILDKHPNSTEGMSAIRMIGQSYYEEKNFDEAQTWYRKLKDIAASGSDQQEAVARIAESMFGAAEQLEKQQNYKDAAERYERAALEFPDAKIADVALYDAGLCFEKTAEWSRAILSFQRLAQKYPASNLMAKAGFRTGKCYEKLMQWDNAAETYLRVVAANPRSDLAPSAMYNAGFSFENASKLTEAAATFEKLVQLYPQTEDAADVLFKAGEIYGKTKDWEAVSRVNQEFTRRFGNDQDRVVQALCMVGVALYMQDQRVGAVEQLKKAVAAFGRLREPSVVNKFYTAKAQYTIGEIAQVQMNAVALTQPKNLLKTQLKEKQDALDRARQAYAKTVEFGVLEWTARSIFQIGQANEEFAMGVMKQQRPGGMRVDEIFALELGIAEVLEEYFVNRALKYHEQNVKLGIKEKSDDKFILASKDKLTYLPYMAGKNYLALATIWEKTGEQRKSEGMALIAQKLEMLQKIAPYQERAIGLLLRCLEEGAQYQVQNEFFRDASSLITQTAYSVGETYAEVAAIAREAPIPSSFDKYTRFVYKTKLVTQIETYENQALDNLLKGIKIAEAYKIDDEYVKKTRESIARLLFVRGRCSDLIYLSLYTNPPYPDGVNEAEKEEYRAKFEEVALKFQEQAQSVYKTILEYAAKHYAAGEFVTQAYVRLFQSSPEEYGVKKEKTVEQVIASGPQWKCSVDSAAGWNGLDFSDNEWRTAQKSFLLRGVQFEGFPQKTPDGMWFGEGNPKDTAAWKPQEQVLFRRTFYVKGTAMTPTLSMAAVDSYAVYLNGTELPVDSLHRASWKKTRFWDLNGKIRDGKNVLAVAVRNRSGAAWGMFPELRMKTIDYEYVAQPPGADAPLDAGEIADGVFKFLYIKNFSDDVKDSKKPG